MCSSSSLHVHATPLKNKTALNKNLFSYRNMPDLFVTIQKADLLCENLPGTFICADKTFVLLW